eukprot:2675831-Rhodomonas_salina.1
METETEAGRQPRKHPDTMPRTETNCNMQTETQTKEHSQRHREGKTFSASGSRICRRSARAGHTRSWIRMLAFLAFAVSLSSGFFKPIPHTPRGGETSRTTSARPHLRNAPLSHLRLRLRQARNEHAICMAGEGIADIWDRGGRTKPERIGERDIRTPKQETQGAGEKSTFIKKDASMQDDAAKLISCREASGRGREEQRADRGGVGEGAGEREERERAMKVAERRGNGAKKGGSRGSGD